MLEKRIMGYANFDKPSSNATDVIAIIDTTNNKVEMFSYNEEDERDLEWLAPSETDRFFPTVKDAKTALDNYKRELLDKMPEMKRYLSAMYGLERPKDKNDPFYFDYKDFLPYPYLDYHEDNYYKNAYDRLNEENELLIQAIRQHTLSIAADTFRIEDVRLIKWGKERAELTLANGHTVITTNEIELYVVKYLFGKNFTDITYTRLNQD